MTCSKNPYLTLFKLIIEGCLNAKPEGAFKALSKEGIIKGSELAFFSQCEGLSLGERKSDVMMQTVCHLANDYFGDVGVFRLSSTCDAFHEELPNVPKDFLTYLNEVPLELLVERYGNIIQMNSGSVHQIFPQTKLRKKLALFYFNQMKVKRSEF